MTYPCQTLRDHSPLEWKLFLTFAFLSALFCSCKTLPMLSPPATPQSAITQCRVGNEPGKPFVAGWTMSEQLELEERKSMGGIVLSYHGLYDGGVAPLLK